MIRNYASLAGFIIGLICIVVYTFFLTPKQFQEVLRPKDWLTNLRWYIFSLLLISIITSVPPLVYQYERIFGNEYSVLRSISTVMSQVSKLGVTILLVLVYTYKRQD